MFGQIYAESLFHILVSFMAALLLSVSEFDTHKNREMVHS